MRISAKVVFLVLLGFGMLAAQPRLAVFEFEPVMTNTCLLYTSDAADE